MISALRSVLAVIIGYVIFAASAYAIFRIMGRTAHAKASTQFIIVNTLLGAVFALAGG